MNENLFIRKILEIVNDFSHQNTLETDKVQLCKMDFLFRIRDSWHCKLISSQLFYN